MKIRTHPTDQADTSYEQLISEGFPGGQANIKENSLPLKSEIYVVEKSSITLAIQTPVRIHPIIK